jgi:hypothetical protein
MHGARLLYRSATSDHLIHVGALSYAAQRAVVFQVGQQADSSIARVLNAPQAPKRSRVEAHRRINMIHSMLRELTSAVAEDEAAKREAFEIGLMATRPLSVIRLQQLCALGERMMRAGERKARAELALAQT